MLITWNCAMNFTGCQTMQSDVCFQPNEGE